MANISTRFFGLDLKSPVIAASSSMTGHAEQVVKLAEAGAGAVVLKSIFEEEIYHELQEELSLKSKLHSDPEYLDYFDYVIKDENIKKYLRLIKDVKAKTRSKRYVEALSLFERTKLYALSDAVSLVKKTSLTKFDGTVELHVGLNPNALGDKKEFRTNVSLPHGTGKKITVAIADDALIEEIASGKISFDILVAHPSMMAKLAKVARILGPKGLMPNPKTGTVSPEPEKRVKELSSGQINIKTEPGNPIIHMPVGKVSFSDSDIIENIQAVTSTLGSKVSKITLSSTMGPGVKVQI